MAADKLAIYNEALGHLGSRELASLAENRDPRRRLDRAWDNAVRYTLEQAPWSFAIRSLQLEPTRSVTPAFGFSLAYQKPDDWLKTVELTSDERFDCPVKRYSDESGFWWTDTDPLFARFVSTDPAYGFDLSRWSATFSTYLAIRLARQTCQRITGSSSMMGDLVKLEKEERKRAKANDALNTAPVFPPMGTWVRDRMGRGGRGDGGFSSGGLVSGMPTTPTLPPTATGFLTADTTFVTADGDVTIDATLLPLT